MIIERAPHPHPRGVTQLQYVSDDVALGTFDEHPVLKAVGFGGLIMGISVLLGADRHTSRWLGVAGVGLGLIRGAL